MAIEDIYKITCNFSLDKRAASFSLFYQEDTEHSGVDLETRIFGEAWATAMHASIIPLLSQHTRFTSIHCTKLDGTLFPKFKINNTTQVGTSGIDALPDNNAIVVNLHQQLFPSSSDGRIYVPGIAEDQTTIGVLTQAFVTGVLQAFVDALLLPVPELSGGAGRWILGVISQKVLNAAPPFKDWEGAFSAVGSIAANTIIGTMRKRQTRVRGYGFAV